MRRFFFSPQPRLASRVRDPPAATDSTADLVASEGRRDGGGEAAREEAGEATREASGNVEVAETLSPSRTSSLTRGRACHVSPCEVLPGQLYLVPSRTPKQFARSNAGGAAVCVNVEDELVYEPYCNDFGPLNIACIHRYCTRIDQTLESAHSLHRPVYHVCSSSLQQKANAAVLIGAYLILRLGLTSDFAYRRIKSLEPFEPFRDVSPGACTYHITVHDCLQALSLSSLLGLLSLSSLLPSEFERLEEADLSWVVPNKIIAFATPAQDLTIMHGYLTPEDYIPYFKESCVTTIIRCNRRVYDKRRFTRRGFKFYDMYFQDGGSPPDFILERFFAVVEGSSGPVAVHCKAGLGRTGVLIGCYLMKHMRFSANQALAYMRMVRPGSVIGQQQHYLQQMQQRMWKAGDDFARKHRSTLQGVNSEQEGKQVAISATPSASAAAAPLTRMSVSSSSSHLPPLCASSSSVGLKLYARSDREVAAAVAEMRFARHCSSRRMGGKDVRMGADDGRMGADDGRMGADDGRMGASEAVLSAKHTRGLQRLASAAAVLGSSSTAAAAVAGEGAAAAPASSSSSAAAAAAESGVSSSSPASPPPHPTRKKRANAGGRLKGKLAIRGSKEGVEVGKM